MVSIVGNRMVTSALFVVGTIVVVFVILAALAWAFQERITFQPERPPYPDPGAALSVDYSAADGQPLFAYIIGKPEELRGLLLSFHGNADLAVRQITWAQEIVRRTGVAVMLAEYRGYMGLTGRP